MTNPDTNERTETTQTNYQLKFINLGPQEVAALRVADPILQERQIFPLLLEVTKQQISSDISDLDNAKIYIDALIALIKQQNLQHAEVQIAAFPTQEGGHYICIHSKQGQDVNSQIQVAIDTLGQYLSK